jgi:hypothetical protein
LIAAYITKQFPSEMIQNASRSLFGVFLVSADKHGRLAARKSSLNM